MSTVICGENLAYFLDGKLVRKRREALADRPSLRAFAKAIALSYPTLSKIENNKVRPDVDTIAKLVEGLRCKPEDIGTYRDDTVIKTFVVVPTEGYKALLESARALGLKGVDDLPQYLVTRFLNGEMVVTQQPDQRAGTAHPVLEKTSGSRLPLDSAPAKPLRPPARKEPKRQVGGKNKSANA